MKALIFSDSHGDTMNMRRTIEKCADVNYVFFLGDGIRDVEKIKENFPDKIFYCVRGNNDWMSMLENYSDERIIEIEGKRILLTHGHKYNVKYTEQNLFYKAISENIDIVLFGHTHTPYEQYFSTDDGGVNMFNPGSIGKNHLGAYYFGRLDISESGVILSHGSINFGKH